MRLPGEGGVVSLPGRGAPLAGIDRKANDAGHRRLDGLLVIGDAEVPHGVGIDRKANRARSPTAWRSGFDDRAEAAR